MIHQNRRNILPPKRPRNRPPLILRQRNPAMLFINTHFAIEITRILREHLNIPPERAPRLPIDAVRVRHSHNLRPSTVHLGMNHEARLVNHILVPALHDVSGAVDEDQVRRAD